MLPFHPEPLEKLQERFAKALSPIYDVDALMAGQQPRIGTQPKHVFDFDGGLRMLVSVERHRARSPEPYLHVSFSWTLGHLKMTRPQVAAYCHKLMKDVSKGRLPICQVEWTPKGVCHLFYEPTDLFDALEPRERKDAAATLNSWVGRARVK